MGLNGSSRFGTVSMQLRPQSVRRRKEKGGEEVAGWIEGVRFGRCGCGCGRESTRGSACVEVAARVVFSQTN